ncbi:putative ArsR-family transcriptional regulator [Actinoplanes missouriensis 431]|uniref:Putative ArsR-family transcriptional regulator n=1 Tax=Actinoplanes missouriensis (strain ATCC 14538 / DSM 43046 / CBS 188.64 / JCM 3121 / NBRC 102363 / NCIMB 12654 / NRRL B-3342 / UNCC 431) TaxID=512565 RepID=I0H131_ACTM4|nr:winged helix-turn-helix domain-containing protein [Actinoplanes missouriensis]BAL86718.1 putative ArsR-family transcriptional regulator [Actinoplanes missouriensis 431]
MGWWNVDADTLAGSRFVRSPLAETLAVLIRLHRGTAESPGELLSGHRDARRAYRARLAADPVDAALVDAVFRPRWIADFVSPAPPLVEVSFAEEVAVVRAAAPEQVRRDLAVAFTAGRSAVMPDSSPFGELSRRADPGELSRRADFGELSWRVDPGELSRRADLGERMAELLTWVWRTAVEPDWARRGRLLEADILARTRQLSLGGWAAALDRMRDGMRWLGEGRLQINAFDYPPHDISGSRLLFVPVTMTKGWVAWSADRYAVIYRCSGLLAGTGATAAGALERLIGPGRARVLVELDPPKSTTQLVAITGQGLGSVGRHLKVLLEAGLVLRRRAGRSVLYARTAAGDAVVEASAGGCDPRLIDSIIRSKKSAARRPEGCGFVGGGC